jgi:hypothetical protein
LFIDDVISNDKVVGRLAVRDAAPRLGTGSETAITSSDPVANLEAVDILVVPHEYVDILMLSY